MTAWTNDSQLDPLPIAPPRPPLVTHPAQLVMLSVAISVPLSLIGVWMIVEMIFRLGWVLPTL